MFRKSAALLLVVIIFITGCGKGQEESNTGQAGTKGEGTAAGSTKGEDSGEKSMGRYLEKEVEVPEEMLTMGSYPTAYMQKLDNGSLAILEQVAGLYISEDDGESFTYQSTPWLSELRQDHYITDVSMAPNGDMAVIYDEFTEEGEDASYEPMYAYVDGEGNWSDIVFDEPDDYIHGFWFDEESRLYAADMNHKVYQADLENGTWKELLETDGLPDQICFTKNYMLVIASNEVVIYDRKEGMRYEGNTVFQDHIMETVGDLIGSNTGSHAVIMAAGEQEDVIYFAHNGGLYRYVIGGTAIEQIIDGNVSSFSDPSMGLVGMAVLPDNEFIVLYTGVKPYRYTYDPNVPTVPEERITIYSLRENYSMRQAVSLYQKENQNIYVRYEIGMSGEDGETAEDAIKNLNTKIMSDSGPDIIVLDGLPAASYKEKGILADVSGVLDGMDGENVLFPNLVDAFREDGKIYGFPMRVQLPIAVGSAEDIGQIRDLKTLADTVEKLRGENPEGSLIGLKLEEQLLYTLGQTSSAAWTKEDGTLNKEALTEFLTQAARIYQAETAGLDPAELEEYRNSQISWSSNISAAVNRYYATASTGAINIAMGQQKLAVGKTYRLDFDFNMITTIAEQENLSYALWQGQVPGGFIPDCTVGVYTGSAENEQVLDFYRFLYGKKVQDMDMSGGFPVNQASFDTFSESPRGEEFDGGAIGISDENGDMFSLDIHWADAEQFERLKEMMGSVNKISTGDSSVEEIVYEAGEKALNGSASVEDTVKEIEKKAAIYLAE